MFDYFPILYLELLKIFIILLDKLELQFLP